MNFRTLDYFLLSIGVLIVGRFLVERRKRLPPKPPGPRPWPLIGNLMDVPNDHDWEVYAKWGKKWGDMISITVPRATIVVLNSYKRCQELMVQKSSNNSDRPFVPMAMEVCEMKDNLIFLPAGRGVKRSRRQIYQELGSSSMRNFSQLQERLGKQFVRRILGNPDALHDHCFQHAGALILRVTYGYDAKQADDPLIKIVNTSVDHSSQATVIGAFLVNQLPILLKAPDWLPGTKWKQTGKAWAKDYWDRVDLPFNFVKRELAEGTAEDSFAAKWLKKGISKEDEYILKNTSAVMFGAGSDTTAVTLYAFFLLMAMHRDVQKKAQAEIDSVVGPDRLPTFEDRDHLPYMDAIMKEVLRYHPVLPNGIPHATKADDIHDGMFIPKGSIIVPNIWNMTHDPVVYKDPMEFNPERFLGQFPERDPKTVVFGFGQRICPGRLFASASIYIALAITLVAFDIAPIDDEPPLCLNSKSGLVSHLHPFKCKITPRMDEEKLAALLE